MAVMAPWHHSTRCKYLAEKCFQSKISTVQVWVNKQPLQICQPNWCTTYSERASGLELRLNVFLQGEKYLKFTLEEKLRSCLYIFSRSFLRWFTIAVMSCHRVWPRKGFLEFCFIVPTGESRNFSSTLGYVWLLLLITAFLNFNNMQWNFYILLLWIFFSK